MGRLGRGRTEQKGKRTHRHGQQGGDCWGQGGIRGLNGNGKKHNKDYVLKKEMSLYEGGASGFQMITKLTLK